MVISGYDIYCQTKKKKFKIPVTQEKIEQLPQYFFNNKFIPFPESISLSYQISFENSKKPKEMIENTQDIVKWLVGALGGYNSEKNLVQLKNYCSLELLSLL